MRFRCRYCCGCSSGRPPHPWHKLRIAVAKRGPQWRQLKTDSARQCLDIGNLPPHRPFEDGATWQIGRRRLVLGSGPSTTLKVQTILRSLMASRKPRVCGMCGRKLGKRKQPSPSNCSPNVHCSPKLGSSSKNPQVLTTAISMPWRRPCCGRFCGSLAFQKGPQLCHGSLGPSCVTTDIAKPTRTSHLGPGAVSQLFADRPALGT